MGLLFGLAFPVLGQTAFTLQPDCGLELASAGTWDGGGLDSRDVLFEDGINWGMPPRRTAAPGRATH
jgi:hypothetical protein